MAKKSETAPPVLGIAPAYLATAQVLLVIALGVDAYLAWISLTGGAVAGCGPSSNCHTVLSSRWATWFSIPVSWAALVVYAGMLWATRQFRPRWSPEQQRRAWRFVLAGAVAILGAGLWFIALQVFVLRTICPFCMTAHSAALLSAILLLAKSPIRAKPAKRREAEEQVYVPPQVVRQICFGALAGVAALVGGQLVWQPKTFASQSIAAGITTNQTAAASTHLTRRQFEIFDGQFKFDLDQVPLVGRRDAPHTLVSLFDYTCHHCREMHPFLMDASRQFSNELSVVSLPMPLDAKCNPTIQHTLSAHTNACALARLGLTVWQANPKLWPQFDDFIFAFPQPPLPAAAQAFARQLVGTENFDRATTNRWVDQQLLQDVTLYEAVYRRFRRGLMPEVIIGTNLISGPFTRNQLFQILSEQFGLKTKNTPSDSNHAPAR